MEGEEEEEETGYGRNIQDYCGRGPWNRSHLLASEDLDEMLDKTQDDDTGLDGPPPAPNEIQIADNIELAKLL